MRTEIRVKAWLGKGTVANQRIIDAALEEFHRIANTYSRFLQDSLVGRLNSTGRGKDLPAEFFELLNFGLKLAKATDGSFDPTIADLLELHGYKDSFDPKQIIKQQKRLVSVEPYLAKRSSWRDIKVDEKAGEIELKPGQKLDFGSIGKGFAVDCAARILAKHSTDFLISAGGDVYAKGYADPQQQRNWLAELQLSKELETQVGKKLATYVDPEGESVCCSGSWARTVGKFHHLIDPHTGHPATNQPQVFVRANTAMQADGLATVAFLQGATKKTEKLLNKYGASLLYATTSGEFITSGNFPVLSIFPYGKHC